MKTGKISVILAGALGMGGALGCTVPVFRYALDHWPPDVYRLEAPEGWIKRDEAAGLRKVLSETQTELAVRPLAEAGGPARLIMADEGETVVWSGQLGPQAAELLNSPARQEIARRLLAGESMVWVVVTGADEEADNKFEETLQSRLEYLASVAAIPEQDPNDPESKLGPGPELRVGFSLLKVARDDPKEQVFLRMLAGPEKDLLEAREPFSGVVFGRGRVLGTWPASALDEEGIDEVSLFLLGACSCRVKFQNPGWDLAMAFDWESALLAAQMAVDKKLEEGPESEPEPAAEPSQPVAEVPEVVRIGDEEEPAPAESARGGLKGNPAAGIIVSGVVGLAGVLALTCLLSVRGN